MGCYGKITIGPGVQEQLSAPDGQTWELLPLEQKPGFQQECEAAPGPGFQDGHGCV